MIAIGVDIGGTSIKGSAITDKGKVLKVFSMPVDKADNGEQIVSKLNKLIKEYIHEEKLEGKIVGIGLGIPGCIDTEKGIVYASPNLRWDNFPIKDLMEKELHLPIKTMNDANAAALGEAKFGAGKGLESSIMITLGTGVGSGVFVNGALLEGNKGMGGELGHMSIELNGRPCKCGRKGCFEQYASASALISDTQKAMDLHPDSLMWEVSKELGKVDGRVSFTAARKGDKYAQEVVDQYIYFLSEGLLSFCNIFRPNVIILSGGVANEGEYLFSRVNKYFKDHNYGYYGDNIPKVDVIGASLGYDSGKIGAAALFFK